MVPALRTAMDFRAGFAAGRVLFMVVSYLTLTWRAFLNHP